MNGFIFLVGFLSIMVGFFIGTFIEQERWTKSCREKSIIRIGYKRYVVRFANNQDFFGVKQNKKK